MSVGTAPGMLQTCCSTQTSSSTALLCVACYNVAVHTATPGCVLRTQCSRFAAVLEQTRRSTASTGLLLLLLPVKLLLSSEQSSLCFDDQAEAQLLLATTHAGTLICREVSCLLASAIHLMLPAGCWLPLAAAALCEQGACLQETHKLTDSLSPYSSLSTESCRKRFSCNMG